MKHYLSLSGINVEQAAKLSSLVAALAMSYPVISFAQNVAEKKAQQAEEVIVTGTLIRGIAPVGAPVIGLGQKDILESGQTSALDLLRELPQILNLGATDSYSNTTASSSLRNNGQGSGSNLRGLGTDATLTLVNSHRMAPGGQNGQLFDPSTIPLFAIERIDVVADGASATYGSDAIAGVINVILKKNFEGAKTQLAETRSDGNHSWVFSQALGKAWDTGSIMGTYEHSLRTQLNATDRSKFYNSDPSNYGLPLLLLPALFNNSPANIRVTTGTVSGIACSSAAPCFFGVPANQNGANLTGASLPGIPGTAANNYAGVNIRNLYKDVTALPRQKRDTLVLTGEQSLSDRVTLFGDALYSNRDFFRTTGALTSNLSIPNSNPYSPCNLSNVNRPSFCGTKSTSTITVPYYFGNDLGLSKSVGSAKNVSLSVGLDVELINDWRGGFTNTYSKTTEHSDGLNSLNTSDDNPDAIKSGGTTLSPAVASFNNNFNPFIGDGSYSASNAALLDKIRAHRYSESNYTVNDKVVRLNGSLFDLPAGRVRLALGAEYRKDSLSRFIDTNVDQPNLNTPDITSITRVNRPRKITSYYAEMYFPLLAGSVQKLDLSVAGRSDKYSDFGSTSNPKVGLTWTALEGLKLNASYGKSFLAPALLQLEPSVGPQTGYDAQGTTLFIGGGNLNLKPTTAKTWSTGLNWKPREIKGLELSTNYYNIDEQQVIASPGSNNAQVLIDPNLASLVIANGTVTQAVYNQWLNYLNTNNVGITISDGCTPQPACLVGIVDGRFVNTGRLKTNGFDLSARYDFDTSVGTWNIGASGTRVLHWRVATTPTTPLLEHVGYNDDAYPVKFRGRAQLGWKHAAWQVTGFANYVGGYFNDTVKGYVPGTPPTKVSSYTTLDLNSSYTFTNVFSMLKNVRVSLNIQNLFDKDPPFVTFASTQGRSFESFDPQNASAIGRQISLQLISEW